MSVNLRYFASLREALGAGEVFEMNGAMSVGALRDRLVARGGRHAELLARGRAVRCALNRQMCDDMQPVVDGDELAFFPPVTGG